jgi:hypothetical protein
LHEVLLETGGHVGRYGHDDGIRRGSPPAPPTPSPRQGKPTLIYRCDLEAALKKTGLKDTVEGEILGNERGKEESRTAPQ